MKESTVFKDYHNELVKSFDLGLEVKIKHMIDVLLGAFYSGNWIYIVGNGGSAATSMHFTCDLRKLRSSEGYRFKVMSLNTNMPLITAIANDDDYRYIFSHQLESFFKHGDVLIAISASGKSKNILEAINVSLDKGGKVIGLLGFDGGRAIDKIDNVILIPSQNYGVNRRYAYYYMSYCCTVNKKYTSTEIESGR